MPERDSGTLQTDNYGTEGVNNTGAAEGSVLD